MSRWALLSRLVDGAGVESHRLFAVGDTGRAIAR
jgi:hypothetical protein